MPERVRAALQTAAHDDVDIVCVGGLDVGGRVQSAKLRDGEQIARRRNSPINQGLRKHQGQR